MPRAYDITLEDIQRLPNGQGKAIYWLSYALSCQGDHHKQWCIERALEALGTDSTEIRQWLGDNGYVIPELGIAP